MRRLSISSAPDVAWPADVRRQLTALFRGRAPEAVIADALLLTSELVANSILHSATRRVTVTAVLELAHLRVEVWDDGPGAMLPTPSVLEPGPAGGIGLRLVDRVATRWGTVPGRPAHVWFEIDRFR